LLALNEKCTGGDCRSTLDCIPNPNILTKLLKPFTCQAIPGLGKTCTLKCTAGLYCGPA
jgi:hypothetical protein